jgi:2-methylcitrate dehydratase PrpD
VRGHPLLRERTDRPDVGDGRSAKVSLQHSVAVALLQGAAGLAQYTDAAVADPAVQALRDKVTAEDDSAIPVEAAWSRCGSPTGRASASMSAGRGTPGRPMSDIELDAKVSEWRRSARRLSMPALIAAIRDRGSAGRRGAYHADDRPFLSRIAGNDGQFTER